MPAAAPERTEAADAFLGVERSLSGRRWAPRSADLALAEELRRRFSLPELAARLLAARGVKPDGAEAFLAPTMRSFFPDPSSFADMDRAAEAIEDAIASGRRTAVFADYDVDGGTSAALLVRYFRARGRDLLIYVPDRALEGYGPSALAFDRLKAQGVELVITVDSGAAAHEPLGHAHAIGLDVVVLDHHLMSCAPPPALAVVNPNRPDCGSGQGHLTAAGVTFVTLAAINRLARKRGSIGSNHLPDLMAWLDLAALGTVCDVAPLVGFNRALVAQGLKILARGEGVGLRALARTAGKERCGAVYDLGFVLGPRLNAGGRIGDASLAARLLSTEDEAEAADLAQHLDALNTERRELEKVIQIEALAEAEREAERRAVVVVGRPSWHPGVIGIAAGRLKERLFKPVIVLGGGGEDAPAKGSGRSVPGVNLGAAVAAAARDGVLKAGGGHAMAAGLTMDWAQLEAFRDSLEASLAAECAAAAAQARTLHVDAVAGLAAVNLDLIAAIERIGPYGAGHPEPLFAFRHVRVGYAQRLKGDHVRAVLEDASGARVPAIAFRAGEGPLGEALLSKQAGLHALVRLSRNTFRGADQPQAEIVDLAI